MGVEIVPGAPGPNDTPGNPAPGQLPSAPVSAVSGANAAVSITYGAVAGQRHRLTFLAYSYSAAPTAGRLTITDGASTVLDLDVSSTWEVVSALPPGGLSGTAGQAMVVTLGAGGAGIIGKVNSAKITA